MFIKNFFNQTEVDVLIANIKEASATKSGVDVLDKGDLKFHALIMHRSEKLRTFISQQKIIDFLKQFAGPDIWVRWDQAVEKNRVQALLRGTKTTNIAGLKISIFNFGYH